MKSIEDLIMQKLSESLTESESAWINNYFNSTEPDFLIQNIIMHKRVIYFLVDGSEIVYIGKSEVNGIKRPFQHLFLGKEFETIEIYKVPDDVDIDKLESILILEYRPKYQNNDIKLKRKYKPNISIRIADYLSVQDLLEIKSLEVEN